MASISYISLHLSISCQVTAKFGTHTSSSSTLFILYLVILGPQKQSQNRTFHIFTAFKIFPVLLLISAGSKDTSDTKNRDLEGRQVKFRGELILKNRTYKYNLPT
jgi:hypothetical protein